MTFADFAEPEGGLGAGVSFEGTGPTDVGSGQTGRSEPGVLRCVFMVYHFEGEPEFCKFVYTVQSPAYVAVMRCLGRSSPRLRLQPPPTSGTVLAGTSVSVASSPTMRPPKTCRCFPDPTCDACWWLFNDFSMLADLVPHLDRRPARQAIKLDARDSCTRLAEADIYKEDLLLAYLWLADLDSK